MAIELIVEDGTGKPDSNTYASLDYVRNYAESLGVVLPSEDEQVKVSMMQAMQFIEAMESRMRGQRVLATQALSWPRTGVYIRNHLNAYNVIPTELKKAQAQLVLDIKEGGPLYVVKQAYALKRRKLEGLEQEWAVPGTGAASLSNAHAVFYNLMTNLVIQGATSSRVVR
ncbi:adaptor [Pantoea phage vB_PagS_Vid5]|uniref:Adaptor n=1 Tax=Pantoea phage vB_PagS_Vid5 TaxID=2099652 RepID=A0A2P1CKJ9_9CAUD|nr:head-tail adaptor Ad1 [Pantoea phage vB_PagS_Vid5]AVJ51766.1 adaptor [Pantoea phage vB_PagS_Vid5]